MADKYWFAGSGTFNVATNWAGGAPAGSEFGLTATFNTGSNSITFARSIGSGNPGIIGGGTNIGSLIRDNNNNLIGTISSGTWPTFTLVANSSFTGSGVAVRFAANAAGTAPGTGDNVFFTDKSSTAAYTVTFSVTTTVVDFTVISGGPIVTFSGTVGLNIAGSLSVGANSSTWSNTGAITFTSTTGTKTITTNATVFSTSNITFNGVGGTWQLQDALNLSNTRTVTLTNGTIDLNNKTLITGLFSSTGSTARGVKFGTAGTGNITVNGTSGTLWTTATFTGFTVTDNGIVNVSSTATSGTAISVLPGAQTEASCLSYNFTQGSYTLTFLTTSTHNAGNVTFSGFTGVLNALSAVQIYKGLTITSASSTMTWTASTSALTFAATSGTWDIDTNSKALDQPIIFGAGTVSGGTWRLLSNFINGSSATASTRLTTLTIGTLNLNNFTYTGGLFSSTNSNARTIAFGTGNITLVASGGTMWTTATFTNFAVTGTPTVNISNNSGVATTITTGALAETTQAVSFNFTSGVYTLTLTAGNKRDLKFTGFGGTVSPSSQTIYGDFVITTLPNILPTSSTWTLGGAGTNNRNINLTNVAAIYLPNLVFNATAATFVLQSNITLSSTKYTYISGGINLNGFQFNTDILTLIPGVPSISPISANGGRFNVTGNNAQIITLNVALQPTENIPIYLTYNGTIGTRIIASGANNFSVYFTGNATDTVSINNSVLRDLDTTNFNGTLSTPSLNVSIYGNLYFASTTTVNIAAGIAFVLRGRSQQFTFGSGATINGAIRLEGGNYKLTSNINISIYIGLQSSPVLNGALDLNGFNITVPSYYSVSTGSSTNTVTMSGGSIILTGTDALNTSGAGAIWDTTNGSNLIFSDSGTVSFTGNTTKSIGGSADIINFPTLNQGGIGDLNITASINCSDIKSTATSASNILITPGNTITASNFSLSGTASSQVTLRSSTAGTQATVSKASGVVNTAYLTIKDIIATGGATWNAPTSSGNVDGGNNTGWNFAAAVGNLYRGIKSRAQAYLGIRTDSQLYKGVRTIGWV